MLSVLTYAAHKSGKEPRSWAELYGRRLLKLTSALLKHGAIDWQTQARIFLRLDVS